MGDVWNVYTDSKIFESIFKILETVEKRLHNIEMRVFKLELENKGR